MIATPAPLHSEDNLSVFQAPDTPIKQLERGDE